MLTEDFTVPNLADGVNAQLTQMRSNWYFLALCAARKARALPNWTTLIISNSSPADYAHPDLIRMTQGGYILQFDYTWTGDNLTGILFKFADGTTSPNTPSLVNGGTAVLTYDGNGNFTGATST